MGIEYSSDIDAAVEDVFAWHARPGALVRLLPPWQPLTAKQEAQSLRDGRAVLGLPGGLRWAAQHQADAYRPPNQFVDVLDSPLLSRVLSWRHEHRFADLGDGRTRVTDRIDTPVPAALLRSTMIYRHRQLADDLAVHTRASRLTASPLTIAMTGSSGLIGTSLRALLTTGGHRVIRLVRRAAQSADERQWRPHDPDPELLRGVHAVIHLAGASIAGRLTADRKAAIRDSRIGPTRRLAELIAGMRDRPQCLVSASAVGFYGVDRGDEVLTESSERGDGFLADVVDDWEGATKAASDAGIRTVHIRTGLVQTPQGGVLRLLFPLFAVGLGGRLADGEEWQPWIGIDDLLDIYLHALVDGRLSGPINAVAPHPVRNRQYADVLASVLRRPSLVPIPALGPQILLGKQGTQELALASHNAVPQRLLDLDHSFRFPRLEDAVSHLLGRPQ